MAKPGDVIEVPQLNLRFEFRETAETTGGEYTEVDVIGHPRGFIRRCTCTRGRPRSTTVIEGVAGGQAARQGARAARRRLDHDPARHAALPARRERRPGARPDPRSRRPTTSRPSSSASGRWSTAGRLPEARATAVPASCATSAGSPRSLDTEYTFVDEWDVAAPAEDVFDVLADGTTYPRVVEAGLHRRQDRGRVHAPALQGPPALPPAHAHADRRGRAPAPARGRDRRRPARHRHLDPHPDRRRRHRTSASTGACTPTAALLQAAHAGPAPRPALEPRLGDRPRDRRPRALRQTPRYGRRLSADTGDEGARARGITPRTHAYEHDPKHESYGLEAAERLGLDPATVFKTLVADVDGKLTVAIVPVAAPARPQGARGGRRGQEGARWPT